VTLAASAWCDRILREYAMKCKTCDGDGWIYDDEDGGTKVCPDCDGEESDKDNDDADA
jgi:DnaJ-class molecular chaperone